MKPRLEKIDTKRLQEQVEEIYEPILQSGQIQTPANPRTFIQWWKDGLVRIFTIRKDNKVVSIKVFTVIPNVLDGSKHHVNEVIAVNSTQVLDEYCDAVLEVFR